MKKNQRFRRKGVLEMLEEQLKSGKKAQKKTNELVELSDSDIKRIEKEIGILKEKIK